jgi:hypothetical protein
MRVLFMLILSITYVHAQTNVSGTISSSTQWTLAGSPYVLSGAVSLDGGAILTVDAGALIYMGSNSAFTVKAGKLLMQGTSVAPIQIASDQLRLGQTAAAGDWGQWTFSAGTQAGTELDHVTIQHGKGLVVNGSTPIFNYVDIRNQLGAAMTLDLLASPSGEGNSASSNQLNAISVPAGDITGAVRWSVKGIPYYVGSGILSVGQTPYVTSVSPSTIQQGEIVNVTVSGTNLTGLVQAVFDNPGLQAQIISSSAASAALKVSAATTAVLGASSAKLLVDAGELQALNALTIVQQQPVLTVLTPATLYTGQGATDVVFSGVNFVADSVVMMANTALTTRFVSQSELHATVPSQAATGSLVMTLKTPVPGSSTDYFTSNSLNLAVVTPKLQLSPAAQSVAQNISQNITLILSYPAPAGGLVVALASSSPAIVTVPAAVTVAEGQSAVSFAVQTASVGTATITATKSGFTSASAQVTVLTTVQNLVVSSQVSISKGQSWSTSGTNDAYSSVVSITRGTSWATSTTSEVYSGAINITRGTSWATSGTSEVYSSVINISK